MIIRLENVSHTYTNQMSGEKVLNNINLELEKSKIYCILGPSGSGKSTLINIIGGLLHPTQGKVYMNSEEITGYNEKQLAELRLNKVGFIFQNFNLIPFLTVKDNVLLQLRLAKKNIGTYMDYYEKLLKQLDMKEKENSYIHELSGGQQQRVAIARCLIIKPQIILADEPTGNLDSKNTDKFIKLVQSVLRDTDTTFIIVTHNEKLSMYCDKAIRINDGSISEIKNNYIH